MRAMITDSREKKPVWLKIIDLILPPRCVLSGEIVAEQGSLAPKAWQSLRFLSAPYCAVCGYPFEFEVEKSALCAGCVARPPVFTTARAALAYDDASRSLILKFKHGDHLQAIPTLIPMLRRAGVEMLDRADLLVPVPLHRWRLLGRRYNQAALLAWGLGRASGIAVLPDGLLRVRATVSQGRMKSADRARNIRRAFRVPDQNRAKIAGKVIVLVDDVFTTGATAEECAKTLFRAGAAEVHVLAIARVVRPQ